MAFRRLLVSILLAGILVFLGVENAALNFQKTTGWQVNSGQGKVVKEEFNQINRQLILPVTNLFMKEQRQEWQQIKDKYNEKKKQLFELCQRQYHSHGNKMLQEIRCLSDKLKETQI